MIDRADQLDSLGLESPFSESFSASHDRFSGGASTSWESDETRIASDFEENLDWLEAEIGKAEGEVDGLAGTRWGEAEWMGFDEAEIGGTGETVEAFAARLGTEWSRRRGGKPDAAAMQAWLAKDHADTQAGARLRWKKQTSADFFQKITRAWMTSRENNMRFQLDGNSGGSLGKFAPPAERPTLVSNASIEGSDKAPVAPLTLRFAQDLKRRFGKVHISNYRGHGGGAFNGRGFSLDLFLPKTADDGFYPREDAIRLLRDIDRSASAVGAQWRVIYNDFAVADAINREFGRRHVIFVGSSRRDGRKKVAGLNWHGPAPLILHFHLDLAPRGGSSDGESFDFAFGNELEGEDFAAEAAACCTACGKQRASGENFSDESFDESEWLGEAEWMGESLPGGDFEEEVSLADGGLSHAERRALDITTTFETGKRGSFYGLTGNFDGQGLSFGLVNWNIGKGSLQPLLRDFVTEHPTLWLMTFGLDAPRFRALILPKGEAALKEQLRFAQEEMNSVRTVNGKKLWAIREPWQSHFKRLSEDPEFRKIQLRYVGDLLKRADHFCRHFKLTSERAFAYMFDAVANHGKWWLTKKYGGVAKRVQMIDKGMAALAAKAGSAGIAERDILLLITDVLAATASKKWAERVRQRRMWFITGRHPTRGKDLAGLQPRADVPYVLAAAAQREGEDLAWSDFETWPGEAEWMAGEGADGEGFEAEEEEGFAFEDMESALAAFGESAFGSASSNEYPGAGEDEYEGGEGAGSGPFASLLEADEALAEAIYLDQDEGFEHEAFECGAPLGLPQDEQSFPGQKAIKSRGDKQGKLLNLTVPDPATQLLRQFSDYDVNGVQPGKAEHQRGQQEIMEFVRNRLANGSPRIVIHLSGSASLTDKASYNEKLSCQRARCLASTLRTGLETVLPSEQFARVQFVTDNSGFQKAICKGAECELGEYRSVRAAVTAGVRLPPDRISPRWDQFEVRVCSFAIESGITVALDELLDHLPEGMTSEQAKALIKILKNSLLNKLTKARPMLGRALKELSKLLKAIPIEIIRETAVIQIRERGKPPKADGTADNRETTLCYSGWGARLAIPYGDLVLDGIDALIDKIKGLEGNDVMKRVLKEAMRALLPSGATARLKRIGSSTPGPWKAFRTSKRILVEDFRGKASVNIDLASSLVTPGTIQLGFESFAFAAENPSRSTLICPDCAPRVVPVIVDGGGFDILAVNTGKLQAGECRCAENVEADQMFEFA